MKPNRSNEVDRIVRLLSTGERICTVIHADNREQIEQECIKAERIYSIAWSHNYKTESWIRLTVGRSGDQPRELVHS